MSNEYTREHVHTQYDDHEKKRKEKKVSCIWNKSKSWKNVPLIDSFFYISLPPPIWRCYLSSCVHDQLSMRVLHVALALQWTCAGLHAMLVLMPWVGPLSDQLCTTKVWTIASGLFRKNDRFFFFLQYQPLDHILHGPPSIVNFPLSAV